MPKTRRIKPRSDIVSIPRDPTYTAFGNQPPLAQRLRTTLRYSETQLRSGLALYDYQYNLNSLFDPNRTGTGHQPKGFDQLAALYQRYRVYKTRWHVELWTPSTIIGVQGVVVPTNSTTSYSDASDAIEATYAKHEVFSIYQKFSKSGVVDLAVLNGKSRVAYSADDTTQALVTTSPAETLMLHIFAESVDGSTTVNVYEKVTLEFDVEFSDPVQLAQS